MIHGHSPRSRRPFRLAAVLLAGTLLGGGAAAAADGPQQLPAVAPQAGFAPLVRTVKPAVVNIATSEIHHQTGSEQPEQQAQPQLPPDFPFPDMFRHFFQHRDAGPEHALGSGFIIDPAGYIVTNNHVIDGATKITVTLEDGSNYKATVIGRDAKTDLALLKISAGKPLPYVSFGSSAKEEVGDWVVAVGNPFGLGGTVTAGIVSAHGRDINAGPYDDFLQIDAPINPGNSGGPLFNQAGQVIGIDSAIYTPNGGSVGIGFAIPSDIAGPVIAQLKDHGKVERGWLGIQMQPVNETMAKAVGLPRTEGVLVDQVLPESPAAQARLQQGDVITRFNGAAITTPRDLALAVAGTHAGQHAQVGIWRGGHDMTLDVAIGAQSKAEAAMDQGGHGSSVGMTLAPLNDQARTQYGLASSVRGVVVTDVTSGSRADESGIQPGDVLVRVGTTPVTSPRQVAEAIHAAERAKKEAVPLLVMRNGTTYYVALQLAAN